MKYLLIAICAATMFGPAALAAPWKGEGDKVARGYEGRGYQAFNYAGRYNSTYSPRGYALAYTGPGYRIVFHERCSFTNDPSC